MKKELFTMTTEKLPTEEILIIWDKGEPATFWDLGKYFLPQICLGICIIVLGTVLFVLCKKYLRQRDERRIKING